MDRRHRVVVVGAGFGGLEVAERLADAPVDVVMIDANNFHTFQPLLYQVATAGLDADDIAAPVRGIVSRHGNVDVRLGRVSGVDLAERRVLLGDGPPVDYDHLVLAAGAVTNNFGVPGVDEHGFGLKTLRDAMRLRQHVLGCFERAAVDPSLVDDGILNVVIAGGGPTGVELAGGLSELYRSVLTRDFPTLDVRRGRIVLCEPTDRLLGAFHPRLSERARRTLASRGVEIVLGVGVIGTDGKAVELDGGRLIPSPTLVWTAGVKANPLAEDVAGQLGEGALTRGGRLVVDDHLNIPGHPEVFVIGDLAGATDTQGRLLPQLAPVAIQAGAYVARVIVTRLEGLPAGPSDRSAEGGSGTSGSESAARGPDAVPGPFRYRDKGSMATIGRHDAVAQLPGGIRLSGPVGWLAWLALHLVMLIGFRNRANVLVNWAWNYLTYDRGSRLIVGSDEPPR